MKATKSTPPRLISMRETCQLTSLSRPMINQLRWTGRFPKAVKVTEKRIAFVRAEVEEWIDQRIAARQMAA